MRWLWCSKGPRGEIVVWSLGSDRYLPWLPAVKMREREEAAFLLGLLHALGNRIVRPGYLITDNRIFEIFPLKFRESQISEMRTTRSAEGAEQPRSRTQGYLSNPPETLPYPFRHQHGRHHQIAEARCKISCAFLASRLAGLIARDDLLLGRDRWVARC